MAKKKKKFMAGASWSTWVLFIVGLSIFSYPIVTQAYEATHQSGVVSNYRSTAAQMNANEKAKLQAEADKRNDEIKKKAQSTNGDTDPDVVKAMIELNQKKDVETGKNSSLTKIAGKPLGVLSIPELGGLRLPIYNSVKEKVLRTGTGIVPGTSLPQANKEDLHTAIMAHSGLPTSKLFTDLGKMKKGDKFYIEALGSKTMTYEVVEIRVMKPDKMQNAFKLNPKENLVTLVSCTPVGVNSHRLLVTGKQVPGDTLPTGTIRSEFLWFAGLMVVVATIIGVLIRKIIRIKQAKMALAGK
ncbi:class C sortase [Weissella confusa]|uniref:class C sortase n=1 Tax=Weissella confusa TaxID=1583 RepID=UPI0022DF5DCF|nr:class C sortase [Weissella confusa]